MSKFYAGIDPGKGGALAIIGPDHAEVFDYPGSAYEAGSMLRLIQAITPIQLCALEQVSAMPQWGVTSVFHFGMNYGGWIGALGGLQVPLTLVAPRKWQKKCLDSGTGETKLRSLSMARRLYPDVELHARKHDGRADALHLARYAKIMDGTV